MIKWPITYTDFDGEERSEDLYFNLSKAELMEMNFEADGAYSQFLDRISKERDVRKLGQEFKRVILKAYGEKSLDGKKFVKRDRDGYLLANDFEQSAAYDALMMEIFTDTEKAIKLLTGMIPKDLRGDTEKEMEKRGLTVV